MSKRQLFVIISGIITAAAIGGWYHDTAATANTAEIKTVATKAAPVPANTPVVPAVEKEYHAADLVSLPMSAFINDINRFAEHEQVRAMLDTSAPSEVIRLVDPDHAPDIAGRPVQAAASDNIPAAFNALKLMGKDFGPVMVCDLAHHVVLKSDDDEAADRMMQRIGESQDAEGFVMHEADDSIGLTVFKCLDESREHCIARDTRLPVLPDKRISCDLAANSLVKCGDFVADSYVLFRTENCDNTPRAGLKDLLDKEAKAGILEADGEKYNYTRTVLNSGCIVVEVVSKAGDDTDKAAAAAPALQQKPDAGKPSVSSAPAGKPIWKIKHLGAAAGGGLLMILIGLWCTRGQNKNAPEKSGEDAQRDAIGESSERRALALSQKDDEIIALKAKIAELESAVDTAGTQNHGLQQELEDSQRALKQQELRSLSLEQDKKELEDALAAAESRNTQVASAGQLTSDSQLPLLNAHSLRDSHDEITAVTKDPLLSEPRHDSLLDALSDDDWDDIADSFDMIMTPSAANMPKAMVEEDDEKIPTNLLNEESSFGVTGFLSSIGDSDRRNKINKASDTHVNTETRLKPVGDTPKLNDLPPVLAGQTTKTGNTLPPVKSVPSLSEPKRLITPHEPLTMRTVERPVISSASELAMEADSKDSGGHSFKPAPSWTGKKVVETGMDTNSLAEALKRRAKDVSEVSMAAVGAESGESNRALSRSGIFSVTGSRVDINPLSDNEYFKSLYDKFVQTQKECNEPTKFTLEQFVSRLAREKSRLIKTYKCKNVRFQIYIKDGKTSLKAMPQK